ncbi:hypothetical protein [Sulfitobacter sp.]|jgi:hypothetical protein|uniref:hypothetical protein n=1 Tax=Sulfitobacter sp. TaxID=1903071 RepID=UPI003051F59F
MDPIVTVLLVIGFIVVCAAGMVWDYYKPARFRTGYHNVSTGRNSGGVADTSTDGDGGGCD